MFEIFGRARSNIDSMVVCDNETQTTAHPDKAPDATKLYNAGISLRCARSPVAPKITNVHASSDFLFRCIVIVNQGLSNPVILVKH